MMYDKREVHFIGDCPEEYSEIGIITDSYGFKYWFIEKYNNEPMFKSMILSEVVDKLTDERAIEDAEKFFKIK